MGGTEYIHDDHVNLWELNNCGNNDHIVPDRSAVRQAGVGDILFMKGKLFPDPVNGLVHRSPDRVYHPGGEIKALALPAQCAGGKSFCVICVSADRLRLSTWKSH